MVDFLLSLCSKGNECGGKFSVEFAYCGWNKFSLCSQENQKLKEEIITLKQQLNKYQMLPISFPESNGYLHKPENMTDEQCMSLPVWRGNAPCDDEGNLIPCVISKWALSKEDLEEINKTGCVWLSITGYSMPPASVFTENPFIQS